MFGFSFRREEKERRKKLFMKKVVCLRRVVPFLFGSTDR